MYLDIIARYIAQKENKSERRDQYRSLVKYIFVRDILENTNADIFINLVKFKNASS
jgi:intergrase/recombinase